MKAIEDYTGMSKDNRVKERNKFLAYGDGKSVMIKETKIRHFSVTKIDLCKAEE